MTIHKLFFYKLSINSIIEQKPNDGINNMENDNKSMKKYNTNFAS